jgi:hypothetical protein
MGEEAVLGRRQPWELLRGSVSREKIQAGGGPFGSIGKENWSRALRLGGKEEAPGLGFNGYVCDKWSPSPNLGRNLVLSAEVFQ